MKSSTKKLAVSALMTALSVILYFVKILQMPYGGSITLFSMVPVMFVGYAYGAKWGMLSGVVLGLVHCALGASSSLAYLTGNPLFFALCLLFDYIVAFGVLGFSGVFKKSIKAPTASFALGVVFAGLLRYICHFISGWIVWGEYAADTLTNPENGKKALEVGTKIVETFSGNALAAVYSLVYNGLYMVPEIIISVIAAIVLISVKPIRNEALHD